MTLLTQTSGAARPRSATPSDSTTGAWSSGREIVQAHTRCGYTDLSGAAQALQQAASERPLEAQSLLQGALDHLPADERLALSEAFAAQCGRSSTAALQTPDPARPPLKPLASHSAPVKREEAPRKDSVPSAPELNVEPVEGAPSKEMRRYGGDASRRWRDSGASKGQFTQGPGRYDPIASRRGAEARAALAVEFKAESKDSGEIQLLDPNLDPDAKLLVLRYSHDASANLKLNKEGAELSAKLGWPSELQYARETYTAPLGKAEVLVRSAVDVGAELKAALGPKTGGFAAAAKAELVALQIQGTAESKPLDLGAGASVKVKGVGALNLGAVGGSGQAFLEYDKGRARAGLGMSASALIGAKAQVVVEVDVSKVDFKQMVSNALDAASFLWAGLKPRVQP